MKVFVWEYLDEVSGSYHSDGGLLVVEQSLEDAVMRAEQHKYVKVGDTSPDFVYDTLDNVEPNVLVFPNAGCC